MAFSKQNRRLKIKKRVRKNISGTADKPRMTVYRSNKQISVQVIDDRKGNTLVAASSLVKDIASQEGNKSETAANVGKLVAERARNAGIETVVFDRNGYLYHGRVKQLADAAREAGLKF